MLVSPNVVSYNRKPVAGQVKALPTVPGGIERELSATSTGRPASLLERQTALDIPQLRRLRSLRVIAALEAKGIFVWRKFPHCGSDLDYGIAPLHRAET